jgi:transcriptional regulator with XRE-family HTH domain
MPETIADRLRYWREKAGLSRKDLAAKLQVDPSAIRHWERGASQPRDLEAVAAACGIDMQRFWSPLRKPKTRAAS